LQYTIYIFDNIKNDVVIKNYNYKSSVQNNLRRKYINRQKQAKVKDQTPVNRNNSQQYTIPNTQYPIPSNQ